MSILATLSSGSLSPVGMAQQAMIAVLKATTAISGSSFEVQQIVGAPDGSYIAGTNSSITGTGSFAAHGDYLVTGDGTNQKVHIWNLSDGSLHMTVPMPSPPPGTNGWGWQIDMHGDYFIAGNGYSSSSGRVTIHNISTGALITTPSAFGYSRARYVAISENYAVATGTGSSTNIDILELATNTYKSFSRPFTGSGSGRIDVYGNNLAFGFDDGSRVSVYDIPTAFANDNLNTSSLTITPGRWFRSLNIEGNYLAAGGGTQQNEQGILIYDLTTGTLLYEMDPPEDAIYVYPGFGNSIQMNGDYLVAGWGRSSSGPVAVYDLTTGTLLQTFTFADVPDTYSVDRPGNFGSSVAITDSKTIVGMRYHRGDATGLHPAMGAFIIYSNPGQAAPAAPVSADWSNVTLEHTLDNPNTVGSSDHHYFSTAAISNTYAIVGAQNAGGSAYGNAYIFDVSDGSLAYTLNNPNQGAIASDNFGSATAISDTHAIVGHHNFDDGTGHASGVAYIYDLSDGSIAHTLNNPNAYTYPNGFNNDFFGEAVSISGDYVIVGASREDDNTGSAQYQGNTGNESGKAYIFKVSDGSLVYTFDNPNTYGTGANDMFGNYVAISSTHAIVGARTEDVAGVENSGAAYIYDLSDGSLVYTLTNPNSYGTGERDYFGGAVGISDTHAIVGAWNEDGAAGGSWGDDAGAAYIYDLSDGSLVYTLTNPNTYGTSAGDTFGWKVAMNDTHAIVSAAYEDDADGDSSGAVYIYDLSDGSLVSTLSNPNAYGTSADDLFGAEIGISDNRVIVGAYFEDDANSTNSGKAYIFNAAAAAPVSSGWTFDLSNVSYDNASVSLYSELPSGVYRMIFNNDGTKMYAVGNTSSAPWHKIAEYSLSTAYDITTSSYNNVDLPITSQISHPVSIRFNNDGTKLYIIGGDPRRISQYSLSVAFDLSTATYSGVDIDPGDGHSLHFNPDGTKMYTVGSGSGTGDVKQYSLSTGFDISTASYDNISFDVTSQMSSPSDIIFNPDGTKMYINDYGTKNIFQYSLSSGFDLSTASYDNASFLVSQQHLFYGMAINGDGTKLYTTGSWQPNVDIHQYSTGL